MPGTAVEQDDVVGAIELVAMLEELKARNHWLGVATGKTRRGLDDALRAVNRTTVYAVCGGTEIVMRS